MPVRDVSLRDVPGGRVKARPTPGGGVTGPGPLALQVMQSEHSAHDAAARRRRRGRGHCHSGSECRGPGVSITRWLEDSPA